MRDPRSHGHSQALRLTVKLQVSAQAIGPQQTEFHIQAIRLVLTQHS